MDAEYVCSGSISMEKSSITGDIFEIVVEGTMPTSFKLELPIRLDKSCLENQTDRLTEEIGLEPFEAQIIERAIRELADKKMEEASIDWPEDVRKAFTNLTVAIMIDESKRLVETLMPLHKANKKTFSTIYEAVSI